MYTAEILKTICDIPVFRRDIPGILEKVLANVRSENSKKSLRDIFGPALKYLPDGPLKTEIIDYALSTLKGGDTRWAVELVVKMNPELNLYRRLPVNLGINKNLENFSRKVGALNYKEWENFDWVPNSKAIEPFRETFHTVLDTTPTIYFEADAQFRDLTKTRAAMAKIHAIIQEFGEAEPIKRVYAAYLHSGALDTGKHLVFRNDEISITSLELFWTLEREDYFAKTIFYENGRPISKTRLEEIKRVLLPSVVE
jgi:hypothetical protein